MNEKKIKLVVPGRPKEKQRARWSRTRMYSPKETVNYETYVKEIFVISYPDFVPLEGPLIMTIWAWLMIPKSTSKKRAKLMVEMVIIPEVRPDWDNLGKIVSDALEGLAYKRDAQIATGIVHKRYSHQPRVEIEIGGIRL